MEHDRGFVESVERGVLLSVLESRMKSDDGWGMLGKDESLLDVIAGDEKVMKRLNLDYQKLAEILLEVIMKKSHTMHTGIMSLVKMTCGDYTCPWRDGAYDGAFYNLFMDLGNPEHEMFFEFWKSHEIPSKREFDQMFSGEPVMIVSGLMPHLIRDHHFFEGRGTVYRCNPEQLARYIGFIQ
jgi:hypothetical protein